MAIEPAPLTGFEPAIVRSTGGCIEPLCYRGMVFFTSNRRYYVDLTRFERAIVCLQGRCITGLCYRPEILRGQCGGRTRSTSMPYSRAPINTNRPGCLTGIEPASLRPQRSALPLSYRHSGSGEIRTHQGFSGPSRFLDGVPHQWQRFQKRTTKPSSEAHVGIEPTLRLLCRQPLTASEAMDQSGKWRIRTPSLLQPDCLANSLRTLRSPSKVRPSGLEPPISALSEQRFYHLSYGRSCYKW